LEDRDNLVSTKPIGRPAMKAEALNDDDAMIVHIDMMVAIANLILKQRLVRKIILQEQTKQFDIE